MSKVSPFKTAVRKETLAEQVAGSIKEAILEGQWQAGEALPTEPELAEAFGVSRAVVRDATRMLAAQGLVMAQHGRGVFVTESQVEAFGDALLLALRREGATVWDVEQFEQMVFPEVCALAAAQATTREVAALRELAEVHIDRFAKIVTAAGDSNDWQEREEQMAASKAFTALIVAVFEATHNAMWRLLGRPILNLHSARSWESEEDQQSGEWLIALEKHFVDTLVAAIAGGDAQAARETIAELMRLPQEAELAMRETSVGKTPHIRLLSR